MLAAVRASTFAGALVVLMGCGSPPERARTAEPAAPFVAPPWPSSSSAPAGAPLRDDEVELMPSGTLLYVWGGVVFDDALDAPLPLTGGAIRPGSEVDWLDVECLFDQTVTPPHIGCAPRKLAPDGHAAAYFGKLGACLSLDGRQPSAAEVEALTESFEALLAPPANLALIPQLLRKWQLPAVAATEERTAVLRVIVRQRQRRKETRSAGCDNVPPGQGCDPYVVTTGRTIIAEGTHFKAATSAGDELDGYAFTGKAPPLFDIVMRRRDTGAALADASAESTDAATRAERRLELLDTLPTEGAGPNVRAAIWTARAIAAVAMRDVTRVAAAVAELQAAVDTGGVDVAALKLDVTLPNLWRIARGEWLLSDPCRKP